MNKILTNINLDPWSYLGKNAISENQALQGTASGAFQLMITIGIIGIMATIIFAFINMGSENSKKREEGKSLLSSKIVVGILLFGLVGILGLVFEIILKIS